MRNIIHLSGFVEEDFAQYKKPVMFLGTTKCDWKCCKECGQDISMCQNSPLAQALPLTIPFDVIYNRYINNPITEAIVIGGLEPMLQGDEVYNLISYFRLQKNNTLFIIYTGYTEEECKKMEWFQKIILLGRIIFKFGRYVPNGTKKHDELLGVTLASDNQYSKYYEGDETSNNND